jgi:hypothetical protein
MRSRELDLPSGLVGAHVLQDRMVEGVSAEVDSPARNVVPGASRRRPRRLLRPRASGDACRPVDGDAGGVTGTLPARARSDCLRESGDVWRRSRSDSRHRIGLPRCFKMESKILPSSEKNRWVVLVERFGSRARVRRMGRRSVRSGTLMASPGDIHAEVRQQAVNIG